MHGLAAEKKKYYFAFKKITFDIDKQFRFLKCSGLAIL